MTQKTAIEWTEATWNPIVGCSVVSPGCTNCYAMRTAHRMSNNPTTPQYHGTVEVVNGNPVWTGKVALAEKALLAPLHRLKPTMYFVNSMGDLFHEEVPDDWIDRVFAVMALCPQHTFQVLTKRADRMRSYFAEMEFGRVSDVLHEMDHPCNEDRAQFAADRLDLMTMPRPLSNVWLGVSAEDHTRADERIPDLLKTPAAVRFVSAEPLLGKIQLDCIPFETEDEYGKFWAFLDGLTGRATIGDFADQELDCGHWLDPGLDWVIAGGESGPGARPMNPEWARHIRDQCVESGTPFFFKQWGGPDKKATGRILDGRTWDQMPEVARD